MNFGRTIHVSTQSLLKEATDWLVSAVERTRQRTARSVQTPAEPVGLKELKEKVKDRIKKWTKTESDEAPLALDRPQVERSAAEHLARGVDAASVGERSSVELVDVICSEWGRPEAVPLANAWLRGDDTELKGVRMENMENTWIVGLIGAAAGAAVLALVLLARRNSSVTAHGREIRVSKDFSALQTVRDQGGEAAEIARSIIESESSPWDFRLEHAVGRLSVQDKRTLLSALVPLDVGVEIVSPSPGEAFDPKYMRSARVVADGSAWVVAASPPEERIGFRLRGRPEVPAEVDACTADWWCLALADVACPIAAAVRSDPDQYIGLDAEYAPCWSVVQGFSAFADLRTEFDERTLSSWSVRLRERLAQWYSASSGRLPVVFGAAGDRYDASVMKSVDALPEADARVIAVAERDGLPQVGLGCVGAPPLLYAIVRVEEE